MWQLMEPTASFEAAPFRLELNFAQPAEGIKAIRCGDQTLSIRPLQISAQPKLEDESEPIDEVYVRGDDLVTTYHLASKRTARPQIVWTAAVDGLALVLDVTIAMQTPLLSSDPSLSLVTDAESAQALFGYGSPESYSFHDASPAESNAVGVFLFRFADCDFSYAEMVFPADFDPDQMSFEKGKLAYSLIREELEKGVIRKARLRTMVVPRDQDESLVKAAYKAMRLAAPPLTT